MEDECTSLASLTQLALSLQKLIALRLRIWSLCASVKFCSFLGLCLQSTQGNQVNSIRLCLV